MSSDISVTPILYNIVTREYRVLPESDDILQKINGYKKMSRHSFEIIIRPFEILEELFAELCNEDEEAPIQYLELTTTIEEALKTQANYYYQELFNTRLVNNCDELSNYVKDNMLEFED